MARKGTKKIVFVIVEGPSDESALDVILARFFESNSVHVEVTHGDITSERFVTSSNIVKKIGDIIKKYAEAYGLKQRDFQEIIHLTDMDGAYISDSAVCKDESADKTIYTETEIRTAKPDHLDEFFTFLCDSEFSVCDNFRISWEYIKTGKHSLERHSNMGICLKTVKENVAATPIGEQDSIGGQMN